MGQSRPAVVGQVGSRIALSGTVGTTSVGPGVKPDTPALPSWPKRLKLSAVTVPGPVRISLGNCRFRVVGGSVTGDQRAGEGQGARTR